MDTYTIRTSTRARCMRLAVHPDGAVVVTVPERGWRPYSAAQVDRFVRTHSAWIRRAQGRWSGREVIRIARTDIPRLKREARELAIELCARYAALYGFTHGDISIRAQKTRWGSCSKKGNLSFNYKIAALPRHLAEYIAVHEVCHRGAFDHSARFWDLVAQEVPDHRARRAALRTLAFVFY